jgi:hypothetical protein
MTTCYTKSERLTSCTKDIGSFLGDYATLRLAKLKREERAMVLRGGLSMVVPI